MDPNEIGVPDWNGIHLHARRVGPQGGVNHISGLGTLEAAELKGDCRTVWNTDSQATSSREPAEGIKRFQTVPCRTAAWIWHRWDSWLKSYIVRVTGSHGSDFSRGIEPVMDGDFPTRITFRRYGINTIFPRAPGSITR